MCCNPGGGCVPVASPHMLFMPIADRPQSRAPRLWPLLRPWSLRRSGGEGLAYGDLPQVDQPLAAARLALPLEFNFYTEAFKQWDKASNNAGPDRKSTRL